MARFVFHLDSLLRHRRHLEQERQRDMAVAQAAVARLEDELRDLDKTTEASISDLRQNHLVGRIDVTYLTAHRRYMLASQRKSLSIAQELTVARRQADEARQHLTEAAKNRKMLEKLKEKHKERWSTDQARREFNEQDDIGMRLAIAGMSDAEQPPLTVRLADTTSISNGPDITVSTAGNEAIREDMA